MEQLDFNILYRWFVGLSLDAPVWDVTVFTKNRGLANTGLQVLGGRYIWLTGIELRIRTRSPTAMMTFAGGTL